MFYKNKDHYENTLKKIIRENNGVEVTFCSERAQCFIETMFKFSDRENEESTCGYDFMMAVKQFDDFETLSFFIKQIISVYATSAYRYPEYFGEAFYITMIEFGVNVKYESF